MWTRLWEIKAFWLKLLWRLFGEIHFTSPTFDCWCQLFYSSHIKSLVARRNVESDPSLSLHKSSFRGLGSQGWKFTVWVMCNRYNKHFVWILIFNFIWVGFFLANDDHPLIFKVNGWLGYIYYAVPRRSKFQIYPAAVSFEVQRRSKFPLLPSPPWI